MHRRELLSEDLHQYVSYDDVPQAQVGGKGKKVIKLDDEDKNKDKSSTYKPPSRLLLRLSKIVIPELEPRNPPSRVSSHGSHRPPQGPPPPSSRPIPRPSPAPAPNSTGRLRKDPPVPALNSKPPSLAPPPLPDRRTRPHSFHGAPAFPNAVPTGNGYFMPPHGAPPPPGAPPPFGAPPPQGPPQFYGSPPPMHPAWQPPPPPMMSPPNGGYMPVASPPPHNHSLQDHIKESAMNLLGGLGQFIKR